MMRKKLYSLFSSLSLDLISFERLLCLLCGIRKTTVFGCQKPTSSWRCVHRWQMNPRLPPSLLGMVRLSTVIVFADHSPSRLYADLVNDSLTEYAYDGDLAGLSYNFSLSSLGVFITLSGYNDKLHVLLQHILERVKTLEVKPDRLEVMKEQVRSSISFTSELLTDMSAPRLNEIGRISSLA